MDWKRSIQEQKRREQFEKDAKKAEEEQQIAREMAIIQTERQKALEIMQLLGVEQMLTQVRDQIWEAGKVAISSSGSKVTARLYLPHLTTATLVKKGFLQAEYFGITEERESVEISAIPIRSQGYVALSFTWEGPPYVWKKGEPQRFPSIAAAHSWLKQSLSEDIRRRMKPNWQGIVEVPYPVYIKNYYHAEVRDCLKKKLLDNKENQKWAERRLKEIEREFGI